MLPVFDLTTPDGRDGLQAMLAKLRDTASMTGDAAKLDTALTSDLAALKDFFTNGTTGLAVTFEAYLERTIGEDGTLVTHQTNLTTQSANIDKQIEGMERLVLANRQRLIDSFVAMEKAQQQINQQLQFLQQRFPSS